MSKQRKKFLERARACVREHPVLGEILTPGDYRELVQPSNQYGETLYSFEWFTEWDNRIFTEINMSAPNYAYLRSTGLRTYSVSMSFRTDATDELIERTEYCESISDLAETFGKVYTSMRWEILKDSVNSGKEVLA